MPDFPIVDSHVHFYDPTRLSYPWLSGVPGIDGRHMPADYRAASAGIDVEHMVFVEVDAAPECRFDEVSGIEALRRDDEPRIAGIVPSALIEGGAAARDEVARLCDMGPIRGIRRQLQNTCQPGWCLEPGFVDGVRMLADFDLSFDLCIRADQMSDATELVRRVPEVRFVMDHIAKPPIASGRIDDWARGLTELAKLPNVVCKMAGVSTEADHAGWTESDLHPYMQHAFDVFGADRLMFGSDWPVVTLTDTFAGWVGLLDRFLEQASPDERRAFWRDTAIRTYRLG
ncbi:MAG: amidohydrolase [Rhodobacteraceae bacterium]|nr:amidohydrolase [Paracoccaceae bacterium]